jgi:AbrB family looped-hinge helix DNA binding protein
MTVSKVGERGAVLLPPDLRRRHGLKEGSVVVAEDTEKGILIRPAGDEDIEIYTPERRAQLLLSNAVDAEDYAEAVKDVRKMGLDPAKIPHYKPAGS